MAIPFCPGYDHEPFATLVANYPGKRRAPREGLPRRVGAGFSQGTVGRDGANPRDWSRSSSARNSRYAEFWWALLGSGCTDF